MAEIRHPPVEVASLLGGIGGGFQTCFFNVHPDFWGNDPISLIHIFQMGWFNHQLVYHSLFDYLQGFV